MTGSTGAHQLQVQPDPQQAAALAAQLIAEQITDAIALRGAASVAFSGGSSPLAMFDALARHASVDWSKVEVFQVDERVAPDGDPARNLVGLREHLSDPVGGLRGLHPIPVQLGAQAAAEEYSATLLRTLGERPALDVVHLGLGADGHTASLVPADEVLTETRHDVAATGVYEGHRRVTLTYPALDRARSVIWLVTGAEKAAALTSLLAVDPSIPASGVRARPSIVVADRDAGGAAS